MKLNKHKLAPNDVIPIRTMSQFVRWHVVPAVVAKNLSSSTPLELVQFLVTQWKKDDGSTATDVLINDEVDLLFEVKTKDESQVGKTVGLGDLEVDSFALRYPIRNGKPAAFFYALRQYLHHTILFSFAPNSPNIAEGQEFTALSFPMKELLAQKKFIMKLQPSEATIELELLSWPPTPNYFPKTLHAISILDAAQKSPEKYLEIIDNSFDQQFWERRVAEWEEYKLFGHRMHYIRRAIESHLDRDYTCSIYVICPQIEGIIIDYAKLNKVVYASFKDCMTKLKAVVLSRPIALFPRHTLESVFDFIEKGSFWINSSKVTNTSVEVNRHGLLHGEFIGFESKELSLKYLLLVDALAHILLHDKMVTTEV